MRARISMDCPAGVRICQKLATTIGDLRSF